MANVCNCQYYKVAVDHAGLGGRIEDGDAHHGEEEVEIAQLKGQYALGFVEWMCRDVTQLRCDKSGGIDQRCYCSGNARRFYEYDMTKY